jgi:hypothetical protein
MSADGSITLVWGDGENRFRYGIGQWRELQEKVNGRRTAMGLAPIGPMTLLQDVRTGNAWPDDIRDILRIGLNGGGLNVAQSHRKLVNHFDATPPYAHNLVAFKVLEAGLIGAPDDEIELKKKTETPATEPNRSDSAPSTARVRH